MRREKKVKIDNQRITTESKEYKWDKTKGILDEYERYNGN